jgi:hypothetical protein
MTDTELDYVQRQAIALWDDNLGRLIPVHVASHVTGADGNTYAVLAIADSGSTQASGDTATPANVQEVVEGLYNGSQIVRARDVVAQGDNAFGTGITAAGSQLYNGGGWDKHRNNQDNITLLASGVITSNGNSIDQTNFNARGLKLFIAPGTFGAGASAITVTLQGKDPVSGSYYTILTSASLTASTFAVLSVYPGLTASANVTANDVLPRTWRVTYQASNWGTGGSTLGIACAVLL